MVKSELIDCLAKKFTTLPKRDVDLCVNQILEKMCNTLEHNGRVEIRGFGSFCLHHHYPRNANNPKTGGKLVTEHKYVPHFKPGKLVRARLNQAKKNNVPIVKD